MNQEQLADTAGLTAVHINRTLQGRRREGLLSLEPRKVSILDRSAMCAVGDFPSDYLQFRPQLN